MQLTFRIVIVLDCGPWPLDELWRDPIHVLNELILNSFDSSPNQIKSTFWKNANFTNFNLFDVLELWLIYFHLYESYVFFNLEIEISKKCAEIYVRLLWTDFAQTGFEESSDQKKGKNINWVAEWILLIDDGFEFERFAQWEKIRKNAEDKNIKTNFAKFCYCLDWDWENW